MKRAATRKPPVPGEAVFNHYGAEVATVDRVISGVLNDGSWMVFLDGPDEVRPVHRDGSGPLVITVDDPPDDFEQALDRRPEDA